MRLVSVVTALAVVATCGCNNRPSTAPVTEKPQSPTVKPLEGKRVVMIVASQKFRDEELAEPRAILAEQGATVTLASSSLAEATGMLGAKARADVLVDQVDAGDYDAIVFVGGSGASEYFANAEAHELCRSAVAQGKLLCAICIAPGTLANAGVLKGKKATVWRGTAELLKKGGATYTSKDVEIDGRIITAAGPEAAALFGRAIADALAK